MSKIEHTPYDIFVKKLEGYMWKTLLRSDLFKLWQNAGWSKVRFPYALGKAKNQEKLMVLSGGILRVGDSLCLEIDDDYWDILDLLIREHAPSGAIIAHEKSLELHMRNFEIPDTVVLYTRDVSKRIEIGPYQFHFRTLQSGEKSKGKNMFRIFEKSSVAIRVWNHTFHTLWIDASMLDVASIKKHQTWISEDILLRFIKKYEKSYSRILLGELVSYRYIRAINRIRTIAKEHGFETLYRMTLDIIKKEGGGCYLHL
jgi:hypothetical protein